MATPKRMLLFRHGIQAAARPFVAKASVGSSRIACLKIARCNSTTTADNPLSLIVNATDALGVFSKELRDISDTINKKITLPSGQSATLKDIVLHSRDADQAAFDSPATARATVLPIAESIETSLKEAKDSFLTEIQPQMGTSQQNLCRYAMWWCHVGGRLQSLQEGKHRVEQSDTPCGRLQKASLHFIQLSFETRFDMAIGCRAAVLIRLANKFGAPPFSSASRSR